MQGLSIVELSAYFERLPELGFVPLGEALRSAGRVAEAVMILRDGLRAHPQRHGARVILAQIEAERGLSDEAEELLSAVLAAEPGHRGALTLLAELARRRGEPATERGLVDRLLRYHPADPALTRWAERLRSDASHVAAAAVDAPGVRRGQRVEREASLLSTQEGAPWQGSGGAGVWHPVHRSSGDTGEPSGSRHRPPPDPEELERWLLRLTTPDAPEGGSDG